MLLYVLYAIFVLACLVLILSVLLQPGKADPGSLFTSSFSSTAFGPRGTQTLLAKITIAAAAAFMLVALMISMGVGGYRSVINPGDASPATQQTPASPAAPAQEPAAPAEDAAAPQQEDAGQQSTEAGATASPAATAQPAATP